MPEPKSPPGPRPRPAGGRRPQVIPLEYAGRWIAWSPDGLRIVAVADSFDECEAAAARGGYPANQVSLQRVSPRRRRLDGSDA